MLDKSAALHSSFFCHRSIGTGTAPFFSSLPVCRTVAGIVDFSSSSMGSLTLLVGRIRRWLSCTFAMTCIYER